MSIQKPMRRRRRPEAAAPQNTAPEVVYTQAKSFQSRRLVLQLVTVFAIVLAIFMGVSVFFKVDTVVVSGAKQYSADTVWAASGIQEGDSLLFFGRAKAYSQIRRELPYVSQVRFGIRLPGTVVIILEEIPVVYAIQDTAGSWWLMSSEGKLTEKTDSAGANNCTRITGVKLEAPKVGEQAVAYQMPQNPDATDPVAVLDADRLRAALQIAKQLEYNEMFGQLSTVDVTDPYQLELWYSTRLRVELGDMERMDYKIAVLKGAMQELGEQCTGVLDISFTKGDKPIHYQSMD